MLYSTLSCEKPDPRPPCSLITRTIEPSNRRMLLALVCCPCPLLYLELPNRRTLELSNPRTPERSWHLFAAGCPLLSASRTFHNTGVAEGGGVWYG